MQRWTRRLETSLTSLLSGAEQEGCGVARGFFEEQRGSSLMVQWLTLHAFPRGAGSIPGLRTKIPYAQQPKIKEGKGGKILDSPCVLVGVTQDGHGVGSRVLAALGALPGGVACGGRKVRHWL